MGIPELVRQEGFEPPAPSLGGRCSILLSYWRVKREKTKKEPESSGKQRKPTNRKGAAA